MIQTKPRSVYDLLVKAEAAQLPGLAEAQAATLNPGDCTITMLIRIILCCCACIWLSACSSTSNRSESASVAAEPVTGGPTSEQAQTASMPDPEVEYGSFTKAQLYQAIISELGAQRGAVSYTHLTLPTNREV